MYIKYVSHVSSVLGVTLRLLDLFFVISIKWKKCENCKSLNSNYYTLRFSLKKKKEKNPFTMIFYEIINLKSIILIF